MIDYTGESHQLRAEGDKFLPAFILALVMIFLVLAAQFNSFRDPLIILGGSVPLALFGAMIFMFVKITESEHEVFHRLAGRRRSTSTRRSASSRSSA